MFSFKQKTAYEMRISDWSSDVCSSDLHLAGEIAGNRKADTHVAARRREDHSVVADQIATQVDQRAAGVAGVDRGVGLDEVMVVAHARRVLAQHRTTDRKSVVKGKSVSVRVDVGGGGIMKKKKKE